MIGSLHQNALDRAATNERLLSAKDAAVELGICVSLFWRLAKTGDLPEAFYITPKAPRWRRSELHKAIEARRASNRKKTT
jgi:predicted DNA-binding transcriptional regulator AlpA